VSDASGRLQTVSGGLRACAIGQQVADQKICLVVPRCTDPSDREIGQWHEICGQRTDDADARLLAKTAVPSRSEKVVRTDTERVAQWSKPRGVRLAEQSMTTSLPSPWKDVQPRRVAVA
jgi:hypothetical protein